MQIAARYNQQYQYTGLGPGHDATALGRTHHTIINIVCVEPQKSSPIHSSTLDLLVRMHLLASSVSYLHSPRLDSMIHIIAS